MSTRYTKDPDARLDYTVDWSSWLGASETISVATFIVPSGLTLESESSDTTSATVWLSGGTVGQLYVVTSRITTNEGRIDDRSILIVVEER